MCRRGGTYRSSTGLLLVVVALLVLGGLLEVVLSNIVSPNFDEALDNAYSLVSLLKLLPLGTEKLAQFTCGGG